MSAFKTCLRTLLVFGLVLIPSLNAENLLGDGEEEGLLVNQVRELLAELKQEETARGVTGGDRLPARIAALNERYCEYIASKNIRGILAMYQPDVLRVLNGISSTGLNGYAEDLEGWVEFVDRAELKTEVLLSLDKGNKFVYDRKSFAMYATGYPQPIYSGTYYTVWKLTNYGYKIAIELKVTNSE
ncbi:uncharacterized protein [Asterias amurensis]|uniref:uncharacterized protein n=1 Tax=Asterias amurensis TaxID=7602 RepID=UPI003AB8C3D1